MNGKVATLRTISNEQLVIEIRAALSGLCVLMNQAADRDIKVTFNIDKDQDGRFKVIKDEITLFKQL